MKRLTIQRKLNRLKSFSPLLAESFWCRTRCSAICVKPANLGWRVTVVAPADESKDISFFKGATISSLQRLKL